MAVANAWRTRLATVIAIAALVLLARWRWDAQTDALVPYVDYDTQIFTQIAAHPFGFELVYFPKPLVVPLVYRALDSDFAAVTSLQANLAFVAWMVLTASLARALQRGWVRVIAIALGLAFLFAPARVGFTASLLSESINDSLTTLLVAGAIALVWTRGRARITIAIVVGLLGLVWVLTRDTNAFIAPTAAGVAMIVWRGWRHRWAWAACAAVLLTTSFAIWTTRQSHAPLPYQQPWDPRFTPRVGYPMLDNVLMRAGADVPPELQPMIGPPDQIWRLLEPRPELRPLEEWILDEGPSAYARWLFTHPIDRAVEIVGARWTLLAGPYEHYMPGGWERGGALAGLTQNHVLLLALVLAAPLLLWRPRGDWLRGLALCIVASGLVGALASYYGDAAEVSRHCYGAGQQLVFGLFLALVARLDATVGIVRGEGHSRTSASGVDSS
jgi:hypothetical protein